MPTDPPARLLVINTAHQPVLGQSLELAKGLRLQPTGNFPQARRAKRRDAGVGAFARVRREHRASRPSNKTAQRTTLRRLFSWLRLRRNQKPPFCCAALYAINAVCASAVYSATAIHHKCLPGSKSATHAITSSIYADAASAPQIHTFTGRHLGRL